MKQLCDTYAVVLDTNSFGKINNYNFKKSSITICLGCLKDYSNIKVFMPSIVYEELKKHIKETVNELRKMINPSYLKEYISLDEIKKIYDSKVIELNKFILEYNIMKIDCNENSDIAQINNWYFECKKPFSLSKPKEFPDAMIISSCINYFKKNKYDNVIMISADNDFISGIKENTTFKNEKNIQNVIVKLVGISEEEYRKCEKYIRDNEILLNEDNYSFYSYDSSDNLDINYIDKYVINKINIININEEKKYYQLCVNCDINVCGNFDIVDQDMSFYDREDPECSVFWHRSGNEIYLNNIDLFILIYYDNDKNLTDYEITKVDDVTLNDYIDQLEVQEY